MPERHTVLVTGVGAVIGYGIIDALRHSGLPLRIVGVDIYDDAYGRYVADDFVQGVRAEHPGYVDFIRRVVADYGVDLIIPGIEQDLYALWTQRAHVPTRIVLNSDRCLMLSRSKLETYRFFSGLEQPFVIPTLRGCSYVQCVAELGLPFVVKADSSYASKGVAVVGSAREFVFHTERIGAAACLYQKHVGRDEDEYTISVFGDGRGSACDSIVLRRRLSQEGATKRASFVAADPEIARAVEAICQLVQPEGPTNIQVRKDGGCVYLLEINARVSSACSIRARMGYNEPAMCVRRYLRGETLAPQPKRGGTAVRYIADHLIFD